jgi:creatinine amidohydrolase
MKSLFTAIFVFTFALPALLGQKLPTGWEELTSSDFALAVKQSEGVCVVPMGVIEKHGQQLPLGTDVYTAREISRRAAAKEYCIVYPYYFMGQIFEAQHQPGTIAYSPDLLYRLLDETCREISRNGIKKIILVNSHGGNNAFLQYFCQTQLATPRDRKSVV